MASKQALKHGTMGKLTWSYHAGSGSTSRGCCGGHEQEVCGLKWSPSGTQLASGGNDNLLHVWSATGAHMALSQYTSHHVSEETQGPWFCQWLS